MVMLSGTSGSWKSVLADAVLVAAKQFGYVCFRPACEPFYGGMSYLPVRELIRQLAEGRQ